jgi:hypothetical protein
MSIGVFYDHIWTLCFDAAEFIRLLDQFSELVSLIEPNIIIPLPDVSRAWVDSAKPPNATMCPPAKQAQLPALLLNEAVEHNRGRLTLPFLKNGYEDYIPSFVEHGGPGVDEKIGEQIKLEAVEHQLQRELKNFRRDLASMFRSGRVVAGLLKQYPQLLFKIDNDSRDAIQFAKRVIDDLAEKYGPSQRR